MSLDLSKLPDDPAQLQALVRELADVRDQLAEEREQLANERDQQLGRIALLESELDGLRRKLFGRKSEKLSPDQLQLFGDLLQRLDFETPDDDEDDDDDPGDEDEASEPRKKPRRKPLPGHLPVEQVVHDVPEDEKKVQALR